jgi:hypothetical protein
MECHLGAAACTVVSVATCNVADACVWVAESHGECDGMGRSAH